LDVRLVRRMVCDLHGQGLLCVWCGRTGVPTGEKSPLVVVDAEVEARSSATSSEGTRSIAMLG
jgi:hypothetical protein